MKLEDCEKVIVSREQAIQINSLWNLCSWPGGRSISDQEWVKRYHDGLVAILGRVPGRGLSQAWYMEVRA